LRNAGKHGASRIALPDARRIFVTPLQRIATMNCVKQPHCLLVLALLFGTTAGCQTVLTPNQGASSDLPLSAENSITVEVRPAYAKATLVQLPLAPDMRLQDAVDASKVRFGKREIYIVRESPRTGRNHKLSAGYDRANRRISMETDYALQPGDRVVIAQDTTTSLETVMQNMLGRS
jgi:hypothetical protein